MSFQPEITLDKARAAFETWAPTSRLTRRALLEAWIRHLTEASESLAQLVTEETGKPITLARGEAGRSLATLQATLEALGTFGEEAIPYDLMAGADGCRATLHRRPQGVVLAITPFNFPLNLTLHKLAPALAAGCSVIWKPCPQAPKTSLRLQETFEAARREVGAPDLVQHAQVPPEVAEGLAKDPRVAHVSFTGSERVGLHLRQLLAGKPLTLELGGNAPVVLDAGIDVARAVRALAPAAVAGAGQSCCHAQRFYVHQALWPAFRDAFVAAVAALPVGAPQDPATLVGPMIDEATAARIEASVDRAVAAGAEVLLRGERRGALLPPILLTGLPDEDPLSAEECFAPVAVLHPIASFQEGLARAAATRFGLRASVYSRDAAHLQQAARHLQAGGVLLNLPPTFRLDAAPFGGLGASGQGLEGPRWAMEAVTDPCLVVEGPAY